MLQSKKYFGDWNFYKTAIMIGVPVMLQSLIQSLISLIDSFMVAGLGDMKMSGVNVAGQIVFVFLVFISSICVSGGIFMTQFSGANNQKGMQQVFHFKWITGIPVLAVFLFVVLVIPHQVAGLMVIGNSEADLILDQAEKYMRLIGFAGIPSLVSMVIGTSYREIGRVKVPLVISVTATLVNTFFNYLFIYGNMGMPRLEVEGAAIATIISRVVEMLLYIGYVMKDRPVFIRFKTMKELDFSLYKEVLRKGSMVVLSQLSWVLSECFTAAVYNGRGGADVVSGMAASFSIANLFFVSFDGITTASAVTIGKALGKNELSKAKQQKTWMLSAAVVFGMIMTGVGLLTMALVPIVFGNLSVNSQAITKQMLLVMALMMPLWIYVNTQLSITKAGGDTKIGMFVDCGTTLVMIPLLLLMANFTMWGPVIMYVAVKSLDVFKIIAVHLEMKTEKWVVNLSAKACAS